MEDSKALSDVVWVINLRKEDIASVTLPTEHYFIGWGARKDTDLLIGLKCE